MTTRDTPSSARSLEAKEITKDYSGVPVLLGVSLSVSPGEVVGLVGHNGAGKSTLLKVLSGAHRESGGDLLIDEEPTSLSSPSDAIAHGISTVYQELSLLPNLTVAENIWLGREKSRGGIALDRRRMRREARDLLGDFGLAVDPDSLVGDHPVATRQLLEIAIASSRDTRYLLLDEPTTSLEGEQVGTLLSRIRALADERGIGVLIINHKLDELYGVADRIAALMNGRILLDAPAATIDRREVVQAIAGADHFTTAARTRSTTDLPREEVLRVDDLRGKGMNGITFRARSAEVLGIYGLGGSGRSEALRAIAGVRPAASGSIRDRTGAEIRSRRPGDAKKRGIAFLTEERKHDGIVPLMDSLMNTALPVLRRFSRAGVLDRRALRSEASELLTGLGLRGDPREPISSLSGGNQQKALIARTLIQRPEILLLDEPSKGVDIGAKSEIHAIMRRLAHEEGIAVVMVSSEEEEILDVADRVLVFAGGRVVAGPTPAEDLDIAQLRTLAWNEDAQAA